MNKLLPLFVLAGGLIIAVVLSLQPQRSSPKASILCDGVCCSGNQVCDGDTISQTNCGSGPRCCIGNCVDPAPTDTPAPACESGCLACSGNNIQECQNGQWHSVVHCNSDEHCEESNCNAACVPNPTTPPECSSGQVQCTTDNSGIERCVNGQWQYSSCPPGKHCQDNPPTCVSVPTPTTSVCQPGTFKCEQNGDVRQCLADGSGYHNVNHCNPPEVCDPGSGWCVAPVCSPGSFTGCDSSDPAHLDYFTCNSTGSNKYESHTCPSGYVCGNASQFCVPTTTTSTPTPITLSGTPPPGSSPTPTPVITSPRVFGSVYKNSALISCSTAPENGIAVSLNNTSPQKICINDPSIYEFTGFTNTTGYRESNYQLYWYNPYRYFVNWTCTSRDRVTGANLTSTHCPTPSGQGDKIYLYISPSSYTAAADTRLDYYLTPRPTGSLILKVRFQGITTQPANPVWTGTFTLDQDYPNVTFTADGTGAFSSNPIDVPYNYDLHGFIKTGSHLRRDLGVIYITSHINYINRTTSNYIIKSGDFNSDNLLTLADITAQLTHFTSLQTPAAGSPYDVNRDNYVTLADISQVLTNYTSLQIPGD